MGQYYLTLAAETLVKYRTQQIGKLSKICASNEYFEKFILLEKWQLGFGGGSDGCELRMSVRLFLRMLSEFLLLIPEAVSREEVVGMMRQLDKLLDEGAAPQADFTFEKFRSYVRGLAKLIGVDMSGDKYAGGKDAWEEAKRQKKSARLVAQAEKVFAKGVKQERIDTQNLLTYSREGKCAQPLHFSTLRQVLCLLY